jgi:glutamate-ammonia-ligase adenylyltransferase
VSADRKADFAARLAGSGDELELLDELASDEAAFSRAEALSDRALAHGLSRSLVDLLKEGSYPARLLALHPDGVWTLHGEPPRFTPGQMRASLEAWALESDISEAIARLRTEVYLGLARRELEAGPLEEIGLALTHLVATCVEGSLDAVDSNLRDEVCVFAMGKLAGDELNYLSDVDLIFVHADHPDDADASRGHRRRTRIHTQLRTVVRHLEGPARWRPVFRVDLRLRPFGTRGPMSMSVTASENYYERHGRDWERQAWLRGRPLAGNLELGETFQARLRPFVYRRTLGPGIFDEVEAVMSRARRDARRGRLGGRSVDLKHDRGGIREIEFFVQALQLMHGGRHPAIRDTSTLGALDRLAAEGLLSDREHRTLNHVYRFLRRLEHRVQLAEGQQRHDLPDSDERIDHLARGLAASEVIDWQRNDGVEAGPLLLATLEEYRGRVCEVTAMFGSDEAPQSSAASLRAWSREVVLDAGAPKSQLVRALEHFGLRDAEEGAAVIAHLDSRRESPLRARGPAREGAISLLFACLDSADPDTALRRLADFAATRPAHFAAWRYLANPAQREVVRRVADLFGASEPLSRGLIGFPNARGIADDGALGMLGSAQQTALPSEEELAQDWAQGAAPELRGEALDRALLRFKSRQLVRIGSYDLGHRADPLEVGACLSRLADLIVAECAADCASPLGRGRPELPPMAISVFALGKYGMEAMDYGSDLDLFFVFDSPESGVHIDAATRLTRRFLGRLQGAHATARLYEVDMRLRPSGGQGLLVSSLGGYEKYHRKGLPIWERLALIRSREVAGMRVGDHAIEPGVVGRRVIERVLPRSVFGPRDEPAELASALRALKTRIETELARETRTHRDAKSGRGACLELELLISALQLQYASAPTGEGKETPTAEGLRSRSILHALSALEAAGALAEGEAEHLADSYRFMRRFLNRLRMLSGRGAAHNPDRFDLNSPRLSALARRMGLASVDTLLDDYRRHSERVRDAFDRHLPA